jgi:hypothetical protein
MTRPDRFPPLVYQIFHTDDILRPHHSQDEQEFNLSLQRGAHRRESSEKGVVLARSLLLWTTRKMFKNRMNFLKRILNSHIPQNGMEKTANRP